MALLLSLPTLLGRSSPLVTSRPSSTNSPVWRRMTALGMLLPGYCSFCKVKARREKLVMTMLKPYKLQAFHALFCVQLTPYMVIASLLSFRWTCTMVTCLCVFCSGDILLIIFVVKVRTLLLKIVTIELCRFMEIRSPLPDPWSPVLSLYIPYAYHRKLHGFLFLGFILQWWGDTYCAELYETS